MAWIRIDDQMPDHPKVAPLSVEAKWAIVRALSYANRFLTNGVLPSAFLELVPEMCVNELILARVWKRDKKDRVVIHDYKKYQPTKAEVEQERALNRKRQAKWRRAHNGVRNGVINGAPSPQPNPTRSTKRSPKPPSLEGGQKIQRGDWKHADEVLRAWSGWCRHDPKCASHADCRQRLAREHAELRRAS